MEKLNISIIKILLVGALVTVSATANAGQGFRFSSKAPVVVAPQTHIGYFFGYGGFTFGTDFTSRGAFDEPWPHGALYADPSNIPINFSMDEGWSAGGGVGFYSNLLNGSRFELEGSYLTNEVGDDFTFAGVALPATFKFQTNTAMINFLKEVPLGRQGGLTSYFGFGLGYSSTKMQGATGGVGYSSRDDGFAWQLIAGVDFPIGQNLALFTQYRYLALPDSTFETDFGDFNLFNGSPSNHSVLFGARVSF
tara:strand:+ start:1070 stop:1822 length:753 start_codon:yes stop_codon:yes gene_type:complete